MLPLIIRTSLALVLLMLPSISAATGRIALIIGIDHYQHLPELANATNDARAIAGELKSLGFETHLHLDIDNRSLYRALRHFESRLTSDGGTGLVFFAGHGIQADGRNYLIPSDARIEVEADLVPESLDAGSILEAMARAGNPLNILVLDACRDNPLPNRTRSASRGLNVTGIPSGAKGTAILYAAGEGQVAQDGPPGGHGVFTEALLSALRIPNLTLEQVIKKTTRGVLERTDGRQRPWSLASLQGDFYFQRERSATEPEQAMTGTGATLSRNEMAHEVWLAIKDSGNRQMLVDFSKRFSDTAYAMAAQAQLALLVPREMPSQPPVEASQQTQTAARVIEIAAGVRSFGPHQMLSVRGTCYGMGSKPGPNRDHDEKYHQVCINDFMIDRYEVTFDAYDEFARATGRELPDDEGMGRGLRPVINVDWDDARAYARWASETYGVRFRLPTEAEWEFACRGGDKDEKYCGGNNASELAVYDQSTTMPVGSKKPNVLGIYDMSGNAWEMTCSPYDWEHIDIAYALQMAEYAGGETKCLEENPNSPSISLVFRGGDWDSSDHDIRSANRRVNVGSGVFQYTETRRVSNLGFRLVAEE